ncbi:hypothetical protein CcaCcLH18_01950 [Colletotrichum camelliae]|nr:hypothetical protein CcaCcLH18_01950 [Colletotrichum camelliae]
MDPDIVEMAEIHHQPLNHNDRRSSSIRTIDNVDITEVREYFGSQERLVPPKQDSNAVFSQHVADTNVTKINWWERLLLTRDLWSPTWNIYLFCASGIAFAMSHHVFYASLEGKIVHGDDQLLMLRYGTALAFAAKASLVASVLAAFREQIWAAVRSKYLEISTLDDMFSAPETPFSLLNIEFLTQAKLVAALALYGWISPLIVILTTNTLLVQPTEEVQQTTCPGVRTLNFSQEVIGDWRDRTKINGLYPISVNFWNTTSVNMSDPGFFDYWAGRTDQVDQVLLAGTILQRPYTNFDETLMVCEKGWNCTAEIEFVGPGYKCQELARGVGAKVGTLQQESGEARVPFPYEDLGPAGNYTWIAHASLGDYTNPQLNDTWGGGIPRMEPPFPKNLGAFRTEPVVWVGYSSIMEHNILGSKVADF